MSGEEKINPGEKMNIQSEYYLETLITDASKGKGFQKISELFEDKVGCSSPKHNKMLLNQLDRLINKELDRNEFKHVSLLMKCIQLFCKSESNEGWSLIQQGLVSKILFCSHYMVLWFERALNFLKICEDSSATISPLVEDFYDTALVICNCKSEDVDVCLVRGCSDGKIYPLSTAVYGTDEDKGVKQLLDTFLFTLGFIILENWPPFLLKLEALKTFNFILDQISREEKKKLNSSEDMCTLMHGLARKLFEVGDYDIQVAITEVLCRMTTKKIRDNSAQKWFEDTILTEAFKAINDKDFETDCRKFLNTFNSRLKDTKRVHTFPCISVSTDMHELTKPQDEKLEHFWTDFNVGSQSISFYIQNDENCLWDSVRLQKDYLSGYSLEECNGQKLLSLHFKSPLSINNKEVKSIKMNFELEHDIQNATIKTYGEDLQMEGKNERLMQTNAASSNGTSSVKVVNDKPRRIQSNINMDDDSSCSVSSPIIDLSSSTKVQLTSPQQNDRSNHLQGGLGDSHEGTSSGEQMSITVGVATRVLKFTEENKCSEVSGKKSIPTASETKSHSPKQQSAEKRAFDVYEFPKSSESASDIEVSGVKVKVLSPMASSSRKTNSTPNRPITRSCQKTGAEKAVDFKDYLSSGSEKSWILERRKKSSAKSADYSRKRQKSKNKLKVLPLSSPSSDETQKPKKGGQPLLFTEIKKATRQEKGVAQSLSFSELKLPGVSGLLTPMDSLPQTSGTLHISDLDQDTMDPLQEISSPEIIKFIKPPQRDTDRKMDIESNEDQIGKAEDLKKKRKRSSDEDEEELIFKPRKLFSSAQASADLEDDVFKSDSHESDITECSFISSFESFAEGLKKKMMTRYKRMEVRAQDVLTTSHLHVSNLMNQIQRSNFRKLDHFRTIVAQELSSFETESQALKELEKETLDFWEAQTVKINEFCTNQQQRIEAMDRTIHESLTSLKKKEERTTNVKENLQKL